MDPSARLLVSFAYEFRTNSLQRPSPPPVFKGLQHDFNRKQQLSTIKTVPVPLLSVSSGYFYLPRVFFIYLELLKSGSVDSVINGTGSGTTQFGYTLACSLERTDPLPGIEFRSRVVPDFSGNEASEVPYQLGRYELVDFNRHQTFTS
ncbi:hypothetical protein E1B28_001595 [Marasmius oreades]|uniref:Uncharacterized protein n=1 Tax=Marasmius oreades TaxID=181124 RepID=A0A9P7V3W1_9AGAR|nr:uncharacterized protein E1B28_001595 [Marasmius oreades]KAG7099783.1 hypothetical protein E1B28_001595 [Marasmius oreades]